MTNATTNENYAVPNGGKSIGQLGNEALWFGLHTLIAICTMLIVVALMMAVGTSSETNGPKYLASALAFFVPMVVAFFIVRVQRNDIARHVWISGLLIFAIVCVWVLDLPTGPGLCEHCGALDKLWRTFFSIDQGSGLMGGDGLLVGAWIPLSLIGYAIGAKLGLDS